MSRAIFNPNLYDVVFLSYDEPNADENYQNLLTIKPKAKRVHKIKGSDAAHKACAELANTEHVIIVDGDNRVLPILFGRNIYLANEYHDYGNSVISFSSLNSINGTSYGNGGVKCWPVKLIQEMRTHEVSTDDSVKLDFDLKKYRELNTIASHTIINKSVKQAFRAGFRDGVKLFLSGDKDFDKMDWRNLDRLLCWMHLGIDVENGIWAIYGARLGCFLASRNFDVTIVNDFDKLEETFKTYYSLAKNNIIDECNKLGKLLNHEKIVDVYTSEQSIEFKNNYIPPIRSPEHFIAGKKQIDIDKFYERLQQNSF
jgi:hypothetical protein